MVEFRLPSGRPKFESLSNFQKNFFFIVSNLDEEQAGGIRAFGPLNFQNLLGFKLISTDIKKKFFLSENVPFFWHIHSNFAKSANMI